MAERDRDLNENPITEPIGYDEYRLKLKTKANDGRVRNRPKSIEIPTQIEQENPRGSDLLRTIDTHFSSSGELIIHPTEDPVVPPRDCFRKNTFRLNRALPKLTQKGVDTLYEYMKERIRFLEDKHGRLLTKVEKQFSEKYLPFTFTEVFRSPAVLILPYYVGRRRKRLHQLLTMSIYPIPYQNLLEADAILDSTAAHYTDRPISLARQRIIFARTIVPNGLRFGQKKLNIDLEIFLSSKRDLLQNLMKSLWHLPF